MSQSEEQQWYRTYQPITLVFEKEGIGQEIVDGAFLSLTFEVVKILHREFDEQGLIDVQVYGSTIEKKG